MFPFQGLMFPFPMTYPRLVPIVTARNAYAFASYGNDGNIYFGRSVYTCAHTHAGVDPSMDEHVPIVPIDARNARQTLALKGGNISSGRSRASQFQTSPPPYLRRDGENQPPPYAIRPARPVSCATRSRRAFADVAPTAPKRARPATCAPPRRLPRPCRRTSARYPPNAGCAPPAHATRASVVRLFEGLRCAPRDGMACSSCARGAAAVVEDTRGGRHPSPARPSTRRGEREVASPRRVRAAGNWRAPTNRHSAPHTREAATRYGDTGGRRNGAPCAPCWAGKA